MNFFSKAEDETILHYIVNKQAYNRVGGTKLWRKMEMVLMLGGAHTWRSMRNRFHRILIKAIEERVETYNLTEEQIFLFINRGENEDGGEE